jgi:hypothetical protein
MYLDTLNVYLNNIFLKLYNECSNTFVVKQAVVFLLLSKRESSF